MHAPISATFVADLVGLGVCWAQDQTEHVRRSMAARCQQAQSPSLGLKIPQKSLKCDAKLKRKGEKAPSTGSDPSKKTVVTETVTKPSHSSKGKSAPKERLTGSGLQQSATPGQSSTTDVAALLKQAFSGHAVDGRFAKGKK